MRRGCTQTLKSSAQLVGNCSALAENANSHGAKKRVLRLSRAHASRARAFFASFHFKLDGFTLSQTVEVQLLQAGPMEENLLSVSGANEAKTAITDYPFDRPLHSHLD